MYHTSLRLDLEYPNFQNQTIFGHIRKCNAVYRIKCNMDNKNSQRFLIFKLWEFSLSILHFIWTCNIIKHLKIINFCPSLNFTWIIIEPFIFMQVAHLCVYAMINTAHWQNKNIVKMRIIVVKMLNNWMILWSFSLSPWFAENLEFGVHSEISAGVSHISIFVHNVS